MAHTGPAAGTVVEIDDGPPPRRITKKKPQKPKVQQAQQAAPRGGFDVPPAGEQRFVPNEVLLNMSPGTSNSALDAIARRHRLTRLELRDFALTQRRLARLRINDGRAVASVIRSLQADARILGAQPNYPLFAASRAPTPQPPIRRNTRSASCGSPRRMRSRSGESVRVAVVDTTIDANASRSRRRRSRPRSTRPARPTSRTSRHRHRRRDRGARQAHRCGAGRVTFSRSHAFGSPSSNGHEHEHPQGPRLGRHVQGEHRQHELRGPGGQRAAAHAGGVARAMASC